MMIGNIWLIFCSLQKIKNLRAVCEEVAHTAEEKVEALTSNVIITFRTELSIQCRWLPDNKLKKNIALQLCQNCILRCYRHNTLFFVNRGTFQFRLQMEDVFRKYENIITDIKDPKTCLKNKYSS
jgi:hypothetical protein